MLSSLKKNKYQVLFSFSIAIALVILTNYLLVGIVIILFSILSLFSSRRFYISLAIIVLLTIVSDINANIRVYVQIFSIGILFFLFMNQYAFNFKNYKPIPSIVIYYFVIFFLSMILSIIFSNYPIVGTKYFASTLIFFLIVYILYSFLITQEDVLNLLYALIITCIIISLSIIYEFAESGFSFLNLAANAYLRMSGLLTNI